MKNLKAYDEFDNAISAEYDPATGEAVFSAEPARITYDYDTGFDGVLMDVEVIAAEKVDDPDEVSHSVGVSGGGCDMGLSFWAAAAITALLLKKK